MGTTCRQQLVPLAVLGHVAASVRLVIEVRLAVRGLDVELVLLTVTIEGLVRPQGRGVVILGLGRQKHYSALLGREDGIASQVPATVPVTGKLGRRGAGTGVGLVPRIGDVVL